MGAAFWRALIHGHFLEFVKRSGIGFPNDQAINLQMPSVFLRGIASVIMRRWIGVAMEQDFDVKRRKLCHDCISLVVVDSLN